MQHKSFPSPLNNQDPNRDDPQISKHCPVPKCGEFDNPWNLESFFKLNGHSGSFASKRSKHALATSRVVARAGRAPSSQILLLPSLPSPPSPSPSSLLLSFLPLSLSFGFGDFLELIPSTETRSIWAPTFRSTFFRFFLEHWNQTLCPFWGCPRFSVPRRWPQAGRFRASGL